MARTQPRTPVRMDALAAILDPESGVPLPVVKGSTRLSLFGLNELPPRFNDPMYLPVDNRGPGRSFDPEYGPSDRLDYWSPREMQMPLPVGREQSFPAEAMRGGQGTDTLKGGAKGSPSQPPAAFTMRDVDAARQFLHSRTIHYRSGDTSPQSAATAGNLNAIAAVRFANIVAAGEAATGGAAIITEAWRSDATQAVYRANREGRPVSYNGVTYPPDTYVTENGKTVTRKTNYPTARPGNSNHREGGAIDLSSHGDSGAVRSWMRRNAPAFGLRTIRGDDPHFEVNEATPLTDEESAYVVQSMGYASVEDFQAKNGLKADGVVGPQTTKAMLAAVAQPSVAAALDPANKPYTIYSSDIRKAEQEGTLAANPPLPVATVLAAMPDDPFGVTQSKRDRLQAQPSQTADPAITQLQTFLAQNGFDPGPADGVMSEQTMAALNAYNAKADPEGAAAAASALAQSGVTNPTPQQTADAFKQATVARQTQVASAPAPQPAPTPEAPQTPQMAYADAIDRFDAEAPAQQAVAEMAAGTGTDTLAGGATPPTPRLRADAIADQLDEALFGAGPYRGEFARGRPEGRFMGGGAPDANAVPNPAISPLAPAVGGPADRRPTPPAPTLRPEGRWVPGAGGAPDAGSVPPPPMRGEPNAPPRAGDMTAAMGNAATPAFPDVYGEQPQRVYADALDRFDMEDPAAMPEAVPAPRTPPRATRETWNSMGLGSRGNAETQMSLDRDWSQPLTPAPPTPPNPYDDWTREFDTPGPITMANERMGVFEGTPDPSTIAPPPNTPEVGNVNYPGPLPTQRLPQTQAAVSEPGMGLGPYGMSPPPPETGPFFDNANPGPMALADALMKDDAYTLPTAAPDFSAADPGPPLRISDPQTPPFLGGRQAGSADLVRGLTADAYANGDLVRPEPPSTVSLVGGGPRELASDIGSYNSGLWATAPTNDIISRAEGWLRSEPQASADSIPQGDSDWSPTPTNAAMIAALDTGDPTGAAPAQTVVADALDAAATGAGQPLIGSYGVMGTTAPRIGVDIYTPPGPSGGMDIRSPEAQTLSITAPPPQAPGAPSGGGMAPVTVQAPQVGGGGGGGGIFGLGANWAGPQWAGDVSSGVGPGGGQWWSGQTSAMGGTGALSWVGSDGRTITAYDSSVNGSWPQQGYSYRIGG